MGTPSPPHCARRVATLTVEKSLLTRAGRGPRQRAATATSSRSEGLVPLLAAAMEGSASDLVLPGADGKMISVDIKLQHVLRRALARADIVLGYVHRCRGRKGKPCRHEEAHPDRAPRRCPRHGILLWPKARVRPVRWHDLRHSTASLLNVAGVPLAEAQTILRRSDPKITAEVYTHVEKTRLSAAANSMPIAVGHLVPQRVVDRMLTGAAKTESKDAEEEKSLGVTEALRSGKRDLNCRKTWKYPNEYDGLSAKLPRRFKSPSLACHLVPLQTGRFLEWNST
jgi:hypothetical protein